MKLLGPLLLFIIAVTFKDCRNPNPPGPPPPGPPTPTEAPVPTPTPTATPQDPWKQGIYFELGVIEGKLNQIEAQLNEPTPTPSPNCRCRSRRHCRKDCR